MNKKDLALVSVLVLLISCTSSSAFNEASGASSDLKSVPGNYETIQAAINAANHGDTILVASGTYYEHVVINKSLSLMGEDKENTIIDGNVTGIVVRITESDVDITGFTVRHSGQSNWTDSGIFLSSGSANNNVSGNIVVDNYHGIYLEVSTGNFITSNNVSSNTGIGMIVEFSDGNTISENYISLNEQDNGIEMFGSASNVVTANTLSANGWAGIYVEESNSNVIDANIISNNWLAGIFLKESYSNTIYHNNFIDNGLTQEGQLYRSVSANVWDNGAEGNYWSDYAGEDSNGDGIGDTNIPHLEVDSHPLIEPWSFLRTFYVNGDIITVLSNSTIASFDFNQSLAQISFHATGSLGTLGFCNVTTPKNLLHVNESSSEIWTVTIDGVFTSYTLTENPTHTALYFTYAHTTRRVQMGVTEPENIPPKADFTFSTSEATPFDIINFTDTSSDSDGTIVLWFWEFGEGNHSSEQNPRHRYDIAQTYVVTLKVTDDRGCETITSKAILVRKLETNMTVVAPSAVNQGELFAVAATLKDENQNPVPNATIIVYLLQEKWKTIGFDKTNASGAVLIEHAESVAGTYQLKTFYNGSHVYARVFTIGIIEIADVTPPIADAGQNQIVTVGEAVVFDASGSTDDIGIVSYEWDFGDGETGTGVTASHTYTSQGRHMVTLTVNDAASNSDTDQVTITVRLAEMFPMWTLGLALVFVGVTVAVIFLWKRREKVEQKDLTSE